MSITLSPAKSLSFSFVEEVLSESEPSIMLSRNLTDLEQMEGREDEASGWSDAFETEAVVLIDLPLTKEHHLRPHEIYAKQAQSSYALRKKNLGFRSSGQSASLKVHCMHNLVLLMVNLGTLACIEYPSMMFIPAMKRIMERRQPEKIPQ